MAETALARRIDLDPIAQVTDGQPLFLNGGFAYDRWVRSTGAPIYRGFYIEDLRTLELGWWKERECNAAFLQLYGQEGVTETRVTEIPPGGSLQPMCLAVDEMVYVLSGNGATRIDLPSGGTRTFEWQARSLFLLHHGQTSTHFNLSSDEPVRLLQYNSLPIAMSAVPDIDLLLHYEYANSAASTIPEAVTATKATADNLPAPANGVFWFGDFFPDMAVWDQLQDQGIRGPGSRAVFMGFPGSEMYSHMAVFPSRRYKRAHRHGPGRTIVIPAGDGFSVMWREGEEKIVIPWHEASVLTPPGGWFHQHFNVGPIAARYLALHPLNQFAGHGERVEDRERDEIDFPNEDPWIREIFEAELGKRGLTSSMPPEVYTTGHYRE